MNYKVLTYQDVVDEYTKQINAEGTTSSLEIKTALRNNNFFALQADVTNFLYMACEQFGLPWTFNGTYRTYYVSLASAQAAFNKSPQDIVQTSWFGWVSAEALQDYLAKTQAQAYPDAAVTDEPDIGALARTTSPNKGDWLAFDYKGELPSFFVTGTVEDYEKARSSVRTFYSRETGADRERVGANVIAS